VQNPLKKILDPLKRSFPKFPSSSQWKPFFRALTKKEKIIFLFCLVGFFSSLVFLLISFYLKNTKIAPTNGGIYIEGVIGQPRFLNPVLASNDVDRNIVELLFSGLMKFESDGKIVPDLAKEYKVKERGTIYEITLKDNIFWQDGQKITTDDVIFTIKTIKDAEFKSPEIANWQGVEVERISEQKLNFKLKDPYFPFLERLTVKILPKHIFGEILAENFPLAIYNLQPIGSGPFRFKEIKYNKLGKIESLILVKNKKYFWKIPYLEEIKFLFFETEEGLVSAAQRKEIQGLVVSSSETIGNLKKDSFNLYEISLPRYFAVFLNAKKSDFLSKTGVRKALNLATDKREILEKVVKTYGKIINSPILPEFYGFEPPEKSAEKFDSSEFDIEKSKDLLRKEGFVESEGKFFEVKIKDKFSFERNLEKGAKGKDVENLQKCLSLFPEIYPSKEITGYFGDSTEKAVILFQEKYRKEILESQGLQKPTGSVKKATRDKLNEVCNLASQTSSVLKFSLVTVNQPLLIKVCEILKEQWGKIGIEVEIQSFEFNEFLRETVRPRNYEMLLFGEALGIIPDPLAFWHSTRIDDPGLNLAGYKNAKADEFLKKARMAQDFQEFKQNLEKFQNILIEDNPAVFLYSPTFLYLLNNEIKGTNFKIISESSKRFSNIENWYIATKRAWY